MFGRGPFKGLFGGSSSAAAAAGSAAARQAPTDEEHGTIEDWFVRTAKTLLGRNRSGVNQPSRLEQKLAALEQENATLREDNRRLADEVTALRTLVFVRKPADRG